MMDSHSLQLRTLAVCPFLAVVNDGYTALWVGLCFFLVLIAVTVITSLGRNFVPAESRYLFYAMISGAASWSAAAIVFGSAVEPEPGQVVLYVFLTAVNGLVFVTSQDFAVRHRLWDCLSHSISIGCAVAALLLIVGALRELFGAGQLFGVALLGDGGLLLMETPAGGLLLFALLLAAANRLLRVRKAT